EEHEAASIVHTFGGTGAVQPVGKAESSTGKAGGSLAHDSPKLRRRGRLDVKRGRLPEFAQPAEHLLVLLCGQHRQRPATPDRHEEEDRPLNDRPPLERGRCPSASARTSPQSL